MGFTMPKWAEIRSKRSNISKAHALDWGVSESLEDEVMRTWPCPQDGRPNELKLHT